LKLRAIGVRTRYWRPGTDYLQEIELALRDVVMDGDVITVSEKAIAVSKGLLIDESLVVPGSLAMAISRFLAWAWGGPIGVMARLKPTTRDNLRRFPIGLMAAHKEVALRRVGLLQALRHYSEGGIDASNLPLFFVSLPLTEPVDVAMEIVERLSKYAGRLTVMIVDGDSTYSWRSIHLAPRRVQTPGLIHFGGFAQFLLGRALSMRARSTPIAIAGEPIAPDRALWYANTAHRISGRGAGRTVWGMARRFNVGLTEITLEMLESVKHTPIVVLRVED
jgi:F420-0:gamma-glutamyl ligase-like protein